MDCPLTICKVLTNISKKKEKRVLTNTHHHCRFPTRVVSCNPSHGHGTCLFSLNCSLSMHVVPSFASYLDSSTNLYQIIIYLFILGIFIWYPSLNIVAMNSGGCLYSFRQGSYSLSCHERRYLINTNNKMKSAPEMIDCQGFVKQKHGETLKGGKLKGL